MTAPATAVSRAAARRPQRRVFLRTHLGLGDHLVCNALVRHVARRAAVVLPVKPHNAASVQFMLRDVPVEVVQAKDDAEADALVAAARGPSDELLNYCFFDGDRNAQFMCTGITFDKFIYLLAGLPLGARYAGFCVQRDAQRERALAGRLAPADGAPYVFVHEDPQRGFRLDPARMRGDLPIVRPTPALTDNIFDYAGLIENAAEVHCFDSSFALLADYMDLGPGRRYLHGYVRTYPDVRNGELLNPTYRDTGWIRVD
ncbi:MAG: hypothetical protein HRU75_14955 [Planctomycetia bacterium]|nr:MAG: hypothetical protein HRU75_14955 [Planctomycetia bacterium]